jgi:hypothetical protein
MAQIQDLLPLLGFFYCIYLFFRWVVRDMDRSSD